MRSSAWITIVAVLMPTAAHAQHDVFFAMDGDERCWWNGNGLDEAGLLREDEVGSFRPGEPSARPYLSMSAQWAFLGDADADGRYADDSTLGPGGDVDVVFLRAGDPAPRSARELFLSKAGDAGFAAGHEDGDVFRFAGPDGALEYFLRESQVLDAIGQAGGDIDVDALCQSAAGDLFLSFDFTESVNGGSAEDGDLVWIPAAAVSYDAAGNVASIQSGTAVVVALESDFDAMALNSGMKSSVGGDPSFTELQALEIDPAGGTWTAPLSGDVLPNLLFGWGGFSNDGAILSTDQGGSIPTLNGVPMASTIATTGQQIGLLPDSTGTQGLNGLAVTQDLIVSPTVENYPRNLITSLPSFHQLEIASATPSSLVRLFVVVGPAAAGGAVPSVSLRAGELFLGPTGGTTQVALLPTDALGFARAAGVLDAPVLVGVNLVFQVLDLGTGRLSAPAALQFL